MKKIYQSPSILVLEMEIGDMLCQSANGGVDGGSMDKEDGEDLGVKGNVHSNSIQWEDWQ